MSNPFLGQLCQFTVGQGRQPGKLCARKVTLLSLPEPEGKDPATWKRRGSDSVHRRKLVERKWGVVEQYDLISGDGLLIQDKKYGFTFHVPFGNVCFSCCCFLKSIYRDNLIYLYIHICLFDNHHDETSNVH